MSLKHPAEGWAPGLRPSPRGSVSLHVQAPLSPAPCGSGKPSASQTLLPVEYSPAEKGQKAFLLELPMKVYWSHWLWLDPMPILGPSAVAGEMWPLGGALNHKSISGTKGQAWLQQKHIRGEGGRWLCAISRKGCLGSGWQSDSDTLSGWRRGNWGNRQVLTRGTQDGDIRPEEWERGWRPVLGQRKKNMGFPKIVSGLCHLEVWVSVSHLHREESKTRQVVIRNIHQNSLESCFQMT